MNRDYKRNIFKEGDLIEDLEKRYPEDKEIIDKWFLPWASLGGQISKRIIPLCQIIFDIFIASIINTGLLTFKEGATSYITKLRKKMDKVGFIKKNIDEIKYHNNKWIVNDSEYDKVVIASKLLDAKQLILNIGNNKLQEQYNDAFENLENYFDYQLVIIHKDFSIRKNINTKAHIVYNRSNDTVQIHQLFEFENEQIMVTQMPMYIKKGILPNTFKNKYDIDFDKFPVEFNKIKIDLIENSSIALHTILGQKNKINKYNEINKIIDKNKLYFVGLSTLALSQSDSILHGNIISNKIIKDI